MAITDEKQITVVDSDGNEHLMEILFTYENEERGTQYVFFFDSSDPDNIIPMRYDDDGNLFEIEDDEEYEEVEEVFNAYLEDPKVNDSKNK